MLKVSLLIQATERVTGPVRRIRSAIRGMVVTGERDVNKLDRIMSKLGRTASRVGRAIGTSLRWGAIGAATAGAGLVASIIKTTSQFEQFQVVLENTEGSAAGAKRAMDWVKDFAKRTPYELADVMGAFVQLKAYGIDPTAGALESLGNASSGMNKPLMSAIEMLADAQTGEFERLKEFGIRAKVTGEKVAFTYMNAGKEVTITAKKSAAEIQKAITGVFDARFKGMMDRQSKTLAGLWSNLKDTLANFEVDVGDAGFFAVIKSQIQRLLDWVTKLAANGTLQKWAKQLSAQLVALAQKLQAIDWAAVASGIGAIAGVLVGFAKFFGWVEKTFGLFNVVIVAIVAKVALSFYGLATALGVVSIAGAPLWLLVGVIAAIAAGALLIWKNWDKISGFFSRMWAGIKQAFVSGAAAIWAALPFWMKAIFKGASFAVKMVGNLFSPGAPAPRGNGQVGNGSGSLLNRNGRPTPSFGPPMRRQGDGSMLRRASADVGGRIDLRIRTDKGTTASVTKAESRNRRVPIDVTRAPLAVA